jgi:hypothetical protein
MNHNNNININEKDVYVYSPVGPKICCHTCNVDKPYIIDYNVFYLIFCWRNKMGIEYFRLNCQTTSLFDCIVKLLITDIKFYILKDNLFVLQIHFI